MDKFPQGTEADVCADIAKRQEHGFKKYGTTVRDNPLTLEQWLQHAYEETLDKAIYLKRAIEEVGTLGKDLRHTQEILKELRSEVSDAKNPFKNGMYEALARKEGLVTKDHSTHNPCDYWGCNDLGLGHHLNCPNNPDRKMPVVTKDACPKCLYVKCQCPSNFSHIQPGIDSAKVLQPNFIHVSSRTIEKGEHAWSNDPIGQRHCMKCNSSEEMTTQEGFEVCPK